MANPTNPVIYLDDFARANFTSYNDWTPIVAAAIASFDHLQDNFWTSIGGTLVFGPGPGNAPLTSGVYNFLTPAIPTGPQGYGIELNRCVHLLGVGRTVLNFAAGLGGIRANWKNYPINKDGSLSGMFGASGFVIENLVLIGLNTIPFPQTADTTSTVHGIYFNVGGKIVDCVVEQFPGHGISAHGGTGDTPQNGCDLASIVRTWAISCGHGIHIWGHDANGILVEQCVHSRCYYGLYDDSLTGAHVIGGQFEACVIDVWANEYSATTTFVSCYKEAGEPVTICGNAAIFGGVLAANLVSQPSIETADTVGGLPTCISGGGMTTGLRANAPSKNGAFGFGAFAGGGDYVMALTDFREAGGAWPFRLKSMPSGGMAFDHGASGIPFFAFLNSRNLKANGYVVDAASIPEFAYGGVALRGLLLTDNNVAIYEGVAYGPPASTAYPVGSVVHNAGATNPGDPILWKLVNRAGVLSWVVGATLAN
jgi:hypothetical protein